jgi:hypothetical protein
MHDWKHIVRKNLRALKTCSPEFAEKITEELASHLEDSYDEHLRAGVTEEIALQRTLSDIKLGRENWLALRLLKEDTMTGFSRKIGLPGLLTFAVAMAFAWALDLAHIQPKTVFLSNGLFLSLPITWFCLLPFCGALGAFVSRRSGGSRLDRMIASAFPAVLMGIVLLLIFAAGWMVSLFVRDSGWNWAVAVPGLAVWLVGYAILTAIPLLAGAAVAERAKKMPGTV